MYATVYLCNSGTWKFELSVKGGSPAVSQADYATEKEAVKAASKFPVEVQVVQIDGTLQAV